MVVAAFVTLLSIVGADNEWDCAASTPTMVVFGGSNTTEQTRKSTASFGQCGVARTYLMRVDSRVHCVVCTSRGMLTAVAGRSRPACLTAGSATYALRYPRIPAQHRLRSRRQCRTRIYSSVAARMRAAVRSCLSSTSIREHSAMWMRKGSATAVNATNVLGASRARASRP